MAGKDPEYTEYWQKTWSSDHCPWYSQDCHMWLTKDTNIDALTKGRKGLKIFVSLCGASPDMKWLGDLGHTVVGVDLGKEAFIKFFTSHNIPYSVEESDACQGTLYKSEDNKYRLYCCNFFNFNSGVEGKFDGLFDCAAMMAIDPDLRNKYAKVICDLMKEDGVCVLEMANFDQITWEGPPFKLTQEELSQHFEPECKVELVDSFLYHPDWDETEAESDMKEGDISVTCFLFHTQSDCYSVTLK